MSDWIEIPLEQLADISSGGTPSRAIDDFWGGDIPWATPSDITRCKTNYLHDTREFITQKGLLSSSAKLLPTGTLLFTSRATIGEIKISTKQVSTNQGFKNLVPKECIDTNFLFYQIVNFKNEFVKYAAGSTFLEINRKDTGRVLILHPVDKNEQHKIGQILQTIDRTITHTEALIEKYQQIKAGLMHDLFTRGIGADGKLRPTRDKAPELYQESSIGWIPKEWDVKPLGKLCDIASGGTPSRRNSSFWNGAIPWIKTGEIKYNEIVKTEEYITQKGLDSSSAKIFNKGTVVMAIYGEGNTRGRVAMLGIDCASNQACVGFTLYDLVQSYFMYFFFENSYKALRDISNDGSQKNLSSSLLKQVNISFPVNKSEQSQIESHLLAIDNTLKKEKNVRDKLIQKKSGLMHDLLTGTVRVNSDPV